MSVSDRVWVSLIDIAQSSAPQESPSKMALAKEIAAESRAGDAGSSGQRSPAAATDLGDGVHVMVGATGGLIELFA